MREIDVIIFDLDGTLIDSRKDIVDTVNMTLAKIGQPAKKPSEIISYVGTGVRDLIARSMSSNKDKDLVDKAVGIFNDLFICNADFSSKLYDNVVNILDFYNDKHKIIITNRTKVMAENTLERFKIKKYFENVIGSDDQSCSKPSACPVKKAIKDIQTPKNRIILVGDMDIDVKTGKNAGILTCAVMYGIGDKEKIKLSKPDHMVGSLLELKNIIK